MTSGIIVRNHGTAAHQVNLAPLHLDEKGKVPTVDGPFVKLPQDRVPLESRPKLLNRFYGAVTVLDATRELYWRQPLPMPKDNRDDRRDCPETDFQSYVNGVCRIVATKAHHGETITSSVVLPGCVLQTTQR